MRIDPYIAGIVAFVITLAAISFGVVNHRRDVCASHGMGYTLGRGFDACARGDGALVKVP